MASSATIRRLVAFVLFSISAAGCKSDVLFDGRTSVYWAKEAGRPVFVNVPSSASRTTPEEIMVVGRQDGTRRPVRFKKIPAPAWQGSGDVALYYAPESRSKSDDMFRYVVFPKGTSRPDSLWLDSFSDGRVRKKLFRKAVSSAVCHPVDEPVRKTATGPGPAATGWNETSVPNDTQNCLSDVERRGTAKANRFAWPSGARIAISIGILGGGWLLVDYFGAPWLLRSAWIAWLSLVMAGLTSSFMQYVCSVRDWCFPVLLILGLARFVLPFVMFFKVFAWSVANWRFFFPVVQPREVRQPPSTVLPTALPPGWRDWDPFG